MLIHIDLIFVLQTLFMMLPFTTKNTKRFLQLFACLVLLLGFTPKIQAQPWLPKEEKGGQANFYEMQKAFNDFWAGKTPDKGKGYKAFKRWEWYWQTRINPDGSFPPAGIRQSEWDNYNSSKKGNGEGIEKAGNWTSLGPNSSNGGYAGIGRINCIAFDPSSSNIIWAGAAGGGLWKSTNNGSSWTTATDNLPVLGVSGIVIDPSNTNIMYIATGDGDASDTYSVGVLKSTNGGATWSTTGLNWSVTNSRVIRRLVQHNANGSILLAASSFGLWRTADAGVSWTQVLTGSFYDIESSPGDPNTLYASTGQRIYRSTNAGASWTETSFISGAGRIALAVTPANTSFVGALASSSSNSGFLGFYASTNSGQSFTVRSSSPNILGWNTTGSDTGGQGWYDLCLAIDPTNANIIYTGGVNTWKSTNGGTSWTINTMWYNVSGIATAHADKHDLIFQNNTTLWQANDGGVYRTTNGGSSWTDLTNGMVISQMYRLGVAQTNDAVITGLQDNGTKFRNAGGTWSDHIGGDGMECAIDPTNAAVMYGTVYYGEIYRTLNTGGNWANISDNIPGQPSGAWVTPYVLIPGNNQGIVAGYRDIYRSLNRGDSWTKISNGLITGTSYLQSVAVAPSNSNVIYTASYSSMFKTTNGGTSWTTVSAPITGSLTYIAVSNTDPNVLWIVMSNYNSGQKVFRSNDGGSTWTNISGTLPNLPVNCIVYQNNSSDGVYIGMDVGVFYRNNSMSDWVSFNTGLPNVVVTELDIQYNTNKIKAATYGRGLWESSLFSGDAPCATPTTSQLSATNITATGARLNTTVTSVNEYAWRYRSVGASTWITPAGTTSAFIDITGLNSGTNYEFQLQVRCGTTWSAWSVSQTFTTIVLPTGCANAITLTCGTPYSNTTNGQAVAFTTYNCAVWNESGPERVHTITTTVQGTLTATLSGLSADLDVFILSVCEPGTCLASGDASAVLANAAAGTYYIVVDGRNGASGAYTLTVDCPSNCTAPTAAQVFATSITETSVRFTCALQGYSQYGWRYRVVGSNTWIASVTSFSFQAISGLASGTQYEFQCQVNCGSAGWSAWSPVQTFTTTGASGICNAPLTSQLSATSISSSGAQLNCSLSGVSEYGWRYRVVGAATWTTPASTTAAQTVLSGLAAATNYEFQVQVRCGTIWSAWSGSQTFTTLAAASCDAPTLAQLSASNISTNSAQLNCSLSGVAEYGWRYRVVGAATWTSPATTTVGQAALAGLSAATNYEFQVQVRCNTLWSAWSVSQTFSTTAAATCDAPTLAQLSASNITTNGAQLNCSVAGVAEYAWRYRIVGAATWTSPANTLVGQTSISGLTAAANYEFQAQVRCNALWSAWSVSQTFSTPAAGAPPANDDPCSAITLTAVTPCTDISATNVAATITANPASSAVCPSTNAYDVWFKADVPANFRLGVITSAGTLTDAVMAFYTGSSCTTLTEWSCEDDNSATEPMPAMSYAGSPGTTIYVRVWGKNGATGTFNICAQNALASLAADNSGPEDYINNEETGRQNSAIPQALTMRLFPQPAQHEVTLEAEITTPGNLSIRFYDLNGTEVKRQNGHVSSPGIWRETINIRDLRSSVYVVALEVQGQVIMERLVVGQ